VTLMTGLVSAALPTGAERIGLTAAINLRLVLTGPGGGTWSVRLGASRTQETAPDDAPQNDDAVRVGIVADAVGFCRLTSARIDPHELDVSVTGPRPLAEQVLAAAAALALD
jgi:hypothetical protein